MSRDYFYTYADLDSGSLHKNWRKHLTYTKLFKLTNTWTALVQSLVFATWTTAQGKSRRTVQRADASADADVNADADADADANGNAGADANSIADADAGSDADADADVGCWWRCWYWC